MTCSIKKWNVLFIFSSLKVAMANETTISPTTEAKGDIICMSIHMKSLKLVSMNKWIFRALLDKIHGLKQQHKGDVTRNDSQRRFLAQLSVQMLECSLSKRCRWNNVVMCCAKNRRCKIVPCNITLKQMKQQQTICRWVENATAARTIANIMSEIPTGTWPPNGYAKRPARAVLKFSLRTYVLP